MPGCFVIARHSSFTYKGRSMDARRIASELGRAIPAGRQCAAVGRSGPRQRQADRRDRRREPLGRALRPEPRGRVRRSGRGNRQYCRGDDRPAGRERRRRASGRGASRHTSFACGAAALVGRSPEAGRGVGPAAPAGDRPRTGLCRGASLVGHASMAGVGALGRAGGAEPAFGSRRCGASRDVGSKAMLAATGCWVICWATSAGSRNRTRRLLWQPCSSIPTTPTLGRASGPSGCTAATPRRASLISRRRCA